MFTDYKDRLISYRISEAGLKGRDIVKVSHGDDHIVILTRDGKVSVVQSTHSSVPQDVAIPEDINSLNIIDIAAGGQHTVALTDRNEIITWGSNTDGQQVYTGQCDIVNSEKRVNSIAAGTYYTACSYEDGSISIWGDDSDGQCSMAVSSDVSSVHSGGEGNVYCILDDFKLVSWGRKEKNHSIANVKYVATGHYHHMVVDRDDNLIPIGRASSNELDLPILSDNIKMISVSGELPGHTLILQHDGLVHGMGNNLYGQIDTRGPYVSDYSGNLAGRWQYISTGLSWSVGVTEQGELIGWGMFNVDY
jgi:alpha-tubulin suppressor-like RCC1 family protein